MVRLQPRSRAVRVRTFIEQAFPIVLMLLGTWASPLYADTYPAQPGRSVTSDGVIGDIATAGVCEDKNPADRPATPSSPGQ